MSMRKNRRARLHDSGAPGIDRSRLLPSSEDVFLSWLLWLPDDADVPSAAADEIARLDRHAPLEPGVKRLRDLLLSAADMAPDSVSDLTPILSTARN